MPRYNVVTFDCYGTLIDWESGIRDAFLEAGRADGRSLPPKGTLEAYAEIEPEVEAGPFRPYREVLAETARRVALRLGWKVDSEREGFLAESLRSWRPFPDTNPALRRLVSAGCRLGILSNVDDDLLESTRRWLEVSFDPIVTAAQVRSYKPSPPHFLEARRRLTPGVLWLHAAQSYFHDVVPCRNLGIPVAWINRKGEKAGASSPPDREFSDLAGFVRWMEEV
jgi:2-haloalkanoic acid dehalogenase type II